MGWIDDLAKERGHNSLRALAHAMRDSGTWPSDDSRSAETVANKLRDLNKGKDAGWWTGTGKPLLPALADALQEDQEDLVERLLHPPGGEMEGDVVLWPFRMFPALRPIDLAAEPPFPGVPSELLSAGGPKDPKTWWHASAGAGKTLVGRWLEFRYGWTFLQADSWNDLDLPERGRVFVELVSSETVSLASLKAIPEALRICVAASGLPPSPPQPVHADTVGSLGFSVAKGAPRREHEAPGFQLLNPAPDTWVFKLLDWTAARVRPGGGFDLAGLRAMFEDEGLADLFETPGELIGFLGMVDEVGLRWLSDSASRKDPMRWVRVWLKAELDRPDRTRAAGIAEVLGSRGPEILIEMEAERHRRGLAPQLPTETWAELVPGDEAPQLDRDRLLAVLEQGSEDALAQVRALLAPDGASIVAGLCSIGVLSEVGDGQRALRPAWVANAIGNAAIERLYADVPSGLGTLLLYPSTSEFAVRALIEQVQTEGYDVLEKCVAETADTPERLVAVDGAFRAAGLALSTGTELPTEVVKAVWDRQMEHVSERFSNWPHVPLIMVASASHWHGASATGAWFAAAIAIARALVDGGISLESSALNPWLGLPGEGPERDACMEALTNVASAFRADEELDEDDPLRLAVYQLGADLLDRFGVLRRQRSLLDIQRPDLLISLKKGDLDEIEEQERHQLLRLPFGLAALEDACQRREESVDAVLAWCWSTWGSENGNWPPMSWLPRMGSKVSPAHAERLWRAAPAEALSESFCKHLANRQELWPWLSDTAWARWFEVWTAADGRWSEAAEAFRYVPEDLALEAIRSGAVDQYCHDIRRVLWERMPEALLGLVDELAEGPPRSHPNRPGGGGPLTDLAYSAPDEHSASMVARAKCWAAEPDAYPGVAGGWPRRWLMRVLEQRSPGWRDAFELLLPTRE